MALSFDSKGNLQPYSPMVVDLDTLESEFAVTEHRKALFEGYLEYVEALKKVLEIPFVQWVNGSYVTLKDTPKDVDVLTWVDYQTFKKKAKELAHFADKDFWQPKGIDCYLGESFPISHKQYTIYEMDYKHWLYDFTRKLDHKSGKYLPKGFLELNF
jgi:hypothetical protein